MSDWERAYEHHTHIFFCYLSRPFSQLSVLYYPIRAITWKKRESSICTHVLYTKGNWYNLEPPPLAQHKAHKNIITSIYTLSLSYSIPFLPRVKILLMLICWAHDSRTEYRRFHSVCNESSILNNILAASPRWMRSVFPSLIYVLQFMPRPLSSHPYTRTDCRAWARRRKAKKIEGRTTRRKILYTWTSLWMLFSTNTFIAFCYSSHSLCALLKCDDDSDWIASFLPFYHSRLSRKQRWWLWGVGVVLCVNLFHFAPHSVHSRSLLPLLLVTFCLTMGIKTKIFSL